MASEGAPSGVARSCGPTSPKVTRGTRRCTSAAIACSIPSGTGAWARCSRLTTRPSIAAWRSSCCTRISATRRGSGFGCCERPRRWLGCPIPTWSPSTRRTSTRISCSSRWSWSTGPRSTDGSGSGRAGGRSAWTSTCRRAGGSRRPTPSSWSTATSSRAIASSTKRGGCGCSTSAWPATPRLAPCPPRRSRLAKARPWSTASPAPARCWARWRTCLPSSCGACRPMPAAISSAFAYRFTRRSSGGARSCADRRELLSAIVARQEARIGHPSVRVPVALRRVLRRGLRLDRQERYASMKELLDALESIPRRRRRWALARWGSWRPACWVPAWSG